MNSLSPKEAASLLRQKDNILILTHRRPDGDTTGCAAGLCLALRQLGKTAWLLDNPDMTEINGTYTAGLWAPADFAPERLAAGTGASAVAAGGTAGGGLSRRLRYDPGWGHGVQPGGADGDGALGGGAVRERYRLCIFGRTEPGGSAAV